MACPTSDEKVEAKLESKSELGNKSIKIQVVSDLHLDFIAKPVKHWRKLIEPQEGVPYLALVGDLCQLENEKLWTGFIEKLVPLYTQIFIVNGNHEFYAGKCHWKKTVYALQKRQKRWVEDRGWSNVKILDNEAVEVEGFRILGCTLWSHVPLKARYCIEHTMNDYQFIWVPNHGEDDRSSNRKATVDDTNRWHEQSVQWLTRELEDHPETPTVILTHHAPLTKGTSDSKYEEKEERLLNHGFATNLESLFQPQVRGWIFGHTHYCTDFKFRNSRVVANQGGYPHENSSYQVNKVVEVTGA